MVPTLYTFARTYVNLNGQTIHGKAEFGPYRSEDEAKAAFQRNFGTWPGDAISTRPYAGSNIETAHKAIDTPMGRFMTQVTND